MDTCILWEMGPFTLKVRVRKPVTNLDKDIKSKRAFVHFKNTDNSCLPRAIMVGYWYLLAMSDPAYKEIVWKSERL